MESLKEFIAGRTKVPLPLQADCYTISSDAFASDSARARSVYNFTNRISPAIALPDVCSDERMIFFGLTNFIRNYMTQRVTYDEVCEAQFFMERAHSFGGRLPFPKHLWMRVINEYNGYLPLKIEALREGSTFFVNEPVIQVTSLAEGFGELAAHIEAVMLGMVSIATARVTICRHWLNAIRKWVAKDLSTNDNEVIDQTARYLIHDFGMRASSCSEESELLGLAHLLVFHGTDTFNAAYLSHKYGALNQTGTSIPALAHRNVQGHKTEAEAFKALYDTSSDGNVQIASYVADCYDFNNAVNNLLFELAKQDKNHIIVGRPDSGDGIQNVVQLAMLAQSQPNIRYIQGDSINPKKFEATMQALAAEGIKTTQHGIFGVGGYLRNTPNRDIFSSAYKLSAKGLDNEPVIKLSHTSAKCSIPGPNDVRRYLNKEDYNKGTVFFSNGGETALQTYYDGGKFTEINVEPFSIKQERTIKEFDSFEGVNFDAISAEIAEFRAKAYKEHNRV